MITPQTVPMTAHSGHPRVVTPHQDRYILWQHMNNQFTRATQSARQTIGNHQRPISDVTVWHWLIANNYRCYPAKGSILTVSHRQELLQWTVQCQNWCLQQWSNIIFSDGIWYCISNADGRTMVLRRCDECYTNAYIMERDTCGRPNIMVWSRMVLNFKLGPIIFQKNGLCIGNGVMATHYLDQVLRPPWVLFFARHGNYTFQHGNACAHSSRATWDFL